jgi:hypothetical protein
LRECGRREEGEEGRAEVEDGVMIATTSNHSQCDRRPAQQLRTSLLHSLQFEAEWNEARWRRESRAKLGGGQVDGYGVESERMSRVEY